MQKISKIIPFIDQHNWKERYFSSNKKDWKRFELNNKSITLNILYVPYNSEGIRYTCISKHNLTHKNQIILLMITDNEKWHHLKKLSPLFCNEELYCLN